MKPRRRASIWDYLAVAYRSKYDEADPRTWMLRSRFLYSPLRLAADIRAGRWGRLPVPGKIGLVASAAAYAVAAAILLGVPVFVAVGLATEQFANARPLEAMPGWFKVAVVVCVLFLAAVPMAWIGFIAIGGLHGPAAVLRRERTSFLHAAFSEQERERELAWRRRFWAEAFAAWPNRRFHGNRVWIDPWATLVSVAVFPVAVAAIWSTTRGFFGVTPGLQFALFATLAAFAVADRRVFQRLRRRLIAALDQVACPDCGYPLEGLPGAPAAAGAEVVHPTDDRRHYPGPARCPECGSPWPLVPPPVPRHTDANGKEHREPVHP